MRYPEFLKSNGTIGFVAPSFGCATEPYYSAFLSAQEKFKNDGFGLDMGKNCYVAKGTGISNTPYECGDELMTMYESDGNDVLISCGGGELMCEILEYLDFEKLKSLNPKWFLGYSDNTNFTFLQTILCDTVSIYGPCAGAFGMKPWHKAVDDTFSLLCGEKLEFENYDGWEKESLKSEENPTAPWNITEPESIRVYEGGSSFAAQADEEFDFKGRLIGGCIDCLVNLIGTKYDKVKEFNERYKDDGFVWFLESCELNNMDIRRAMWHMDNAGWFKYVRGFIIGRPMVYGENLMGLDHYEAVMGVLRKYNVPVVMDADLGHLAPSMPVICGSIGEVSAKAGSLKIKYILE